MRVALPGVSMSNFVQILPWHEEQFYTDPLGHLT
jgi:hypothetical protein